MRAAALAQELWWPVLVSLACRPATARRGFTGKTLWAAMACWELPTARAGRAYGASRLGRNSPPMDPTVCTVRRTAQLVRAWQGSTQIRTELVFMARGTPECSVPAPPECTGLVLPECTAPAPAAPESTPSRPPGVGPWTP